MARPVAGEAFAYATARLSPTARRILEAAHRVLTRDGYEGLTLRRIAAEAGETKSLIIYHFESKAGLVATLVDSLWHDTDVALVDGLHEPPDPLTGHARELIALHRDLALQTSLYATYFDLLPYILRDRDARRRLAEFYDSYRRIGVMCLESSTVPLEDRDALTTLLLGIGEGVAAQALIDPDAVDTEGVFALLAEMLYACLGGTAGPLVAQVREAVDWESGAPPLPPETEPDPAGDLAPVAVNLLTAARQVVHERGFRALTLETVAARAGEPRSAVSYYFGDKRGLVHRLHATVDHQNRALMRRAVRRLPVGVKRIPAVIATQERALTRLTAFRRHYELLPVVLRDEALRVREASAHRSLRDALAGCLAGSDEPGRLRRLQGLASLSIAAPAGLAIQRLVASEDVDPAAALHLWTRIVMGALKAPVTPD
ncbi:MAG: TetR/AcrR family transcriptional regulator [Thermoleophilia bacterium]|nr:TetR/AcrR family transcriptional regulator [Thermoleophilia bacterium]